MPKYERRDNLRIFKDYGVDEISKRMFKMFSPEYILQMRNGYRPLTSRFREVATEVFGMPESELFAPAEESDGDAERTE